MTNYELEYSKFLADISQKVAEFIRNGYLYENINNKSVYDEQTQKEVETQNIDTNNIFENVDNTKVNLIEYVPETQYNISEILKNKTLWYVLGAIFLYKLLKK